MSSKAKSEGLPILAYIALCAVTVLVMLLCVCVGSVNIPFGETASAIFGAIAGIAAPGGVSAPIILNVRLPRVICAALMGASLSICGAAMQGLLRNPLADGTTLGVSQGASLGAVLAIALGIKIPFFNSGAIMVNAMLFAFLSLLIILSLAHQLDYSLSTNTIILIGIIFSMFCSSISSLVATFAGERAKNILFWTMGSLAGSNYSSVVVLAIALFVCGAVLLSFSRELNAFAISENNAAHVGINVKRTKLVVLIAIAALTGVCVSIGGTIGFVGLVIPHITRMLTGPNHRSLLSVSLFSGAIFLMLADLVSRVILRPVELPIGVITSMIGSIVFIYIFYSLRKVR